MTRFNVSVLEKIKWEESASQLRMLSKNLLEINTLKKLTCIGFADAGFLKTALNKQKKKVKIWHIMSWLKISNEYVII